MKEKFIWHSLLNGERHLVPSVVFQANFIQGSKIFIIYKDKRLEEKPICVSQSIQNYMESKMVKIDIYDKRTERQIKQDIHDNDGYCPCQVEHAFRH